MSRQVSVYLILAVGLAMGQILQAPAPFGDNGEPQQTPFRSILSPESSPWTGINPDGSTFEMGRNPGGISRAVIVGPEGDVVPEVVVSSSPLPNPTVTSTSTATPTGSISNTLVPVTVSTTIASSVTQHPVVSPPPLASSSAAPQPFSIPPPPARVSPAIQINAQHVGATSGSLPAMRPVAADADSITPQTVQNAGDTLPIVNNLNTNGNNAQSAESQPGAKFPDSGASSSSLLTALAAVGGVAFLLVGGLVVYRLQKARKGRHYSMDDDDEALNGNMGTAGRQKWTDFTHWIPQSLREKSGPAPPTKDRIPSILKDDHVPLPNVISMDGRVSLESPLVEAQAAPEFILPPSVPSSMMDNSGLSKRDSDSSLVHYFKERPESMSSSSGSSNTHRSSIISSTGSSATYLTEDQEGVNNTSPSLGSHRLSHRWSPTLSSPLGPRSPLAKPGVSPLLHKALSNNRLSGQPARPLSVLSSAHSSPALSTRPVSMASIRSESSAASDDSLSQYL